LSGRRASRAGIASSAVIHTKLWLHQTLLPRATAINNRGRVGGAVVVRRGGGGGEGEAGGG
jgi:hypothetical protein